MYSAGYCLSVLAEVCDGGCQCILYTFISAVIVRRSLRLGCCCGGKQPLAEDKVGRVDPVSAITLPDGCPMVATIIDLI